MIEEIRLTILNNLLQYHPESAEELAWGPKVRKPSSFDSTSPLGLANRQHVVDTYIDVSENEAGTFTVINLKTTDRPGLLVDIVRVLKDINVNVVSAEVDTEGKYAVDTFYVTYGMGCGNHVCGGVCGGMTNVPLHRYHGEPLNSSMVQLVTKYVVLYNGRHVLSLCLLHSFATFYTPTSTRTTLHSCLQYYLSMASVEREESY